MKIAQRIHLFQVLKDDDYEKLAQFLEEHRSCFDELTIFTGFCHHGAIPLSELRPQAEVLAKRVADLKRRGFGSVGLNVHTTFGHIDEGYECYGQPFHPMVGYRGDYAKGCFCPQHEDMRDFLREKYTMYAQTNPDFLWVDDDVKFFWNGVKFACFCPACMERFNKKMGTSYTRETLVAAMEEPDAIELRAAWVQDIRDRITELFSMIRDTVRAVSPNIRLGFQTQHQGWSTYNGMDFASWMPALDACMARPGEGTYDDKTPLTVCTKALSTARQAAEYPDCITDVQYEVEDFPNYSFLQKSRRINLDECTLTVAQGMNGVLLNSLYPDGSMNGVELGALYDDIARMRPGWDKMEVFSRGMHGVGFYPAVSTKYDQRRPLHDGQSFFTTYDEAPNHNCMQTYSLCHIGLPLTVEPEHAYGAVFTGDLPDGFTDEELLAFLGKSVIVDAGALRAFERRGLGKYLGVHCGDQSYVDSIVEHFADHPVNEGFVGHMRDVHPAFYGSEAVLLEPLDEKVEPISYLCGLHNERLGVAASLYENELGGRVCVLGYAAYHKIDSYARWVQMQRVASYLTKNTECTKLFQPHLAAQFVRTDGNRTMATIINLSLDPAALTYGIRGAVKAKLIHGAEQREICASEQAEYGVFQLPELLPFETCTLLVD